MTGKEFLRQYAIIDRQIQSIKLQLDGITKMAHDNAKNIDFHPEIDSLNKRQEELILESVTVRKNILDRIHRIENIERRQILIKRYLESKSVTAISREMFMTYQGVYYHLEIGEKEIEKLI